jgi:hypothetical protein
MKTSGIFLSGLLLLAFACSDDDNNEAAVANDEAAEMIASSVSSDAGGLASVLYDASVSSQANAGGRAQACGYSESLDVAKTNLPGARITYSYAYHYDYALTCANNLPATYTSNIAYHGSLSTPRMSTENEGTGNLTIQTLDAAYQYFTFNGAYNRTGSFVSNIRNKNTSNSTITFEIDGITVDKESKTITGGSASITITGSVAGKGSFSYSGTITFPGGQLADLDINGTLYSLNIATGEFTAQ